VDSLLTRLEAASEGSREMDAEIAFAAGRFDIWVEWTDEGNLASHAGRGEVMKVLAILFALGCQTIVNTQTNQVCTICCNQFGCTTTCSP